MIKINLLKNRGDAAQANTSTSTVNYETYFDNGADGASGGKLIFSRLLVMFMATASLMIYEHYNIDNLQSQKTELNAKLNEAKAKLQQKQPLADNALILQKKIQDLEARIRAIKDLSKIRLREIKAIDYIQNVIPERVWLTTLNIDGDKVQIDGGALSDEQLSRFMDAIDGKSFFRNVILLRAVEEKTKEGTVKKFQISSSLTTTE